MANHDHGPWVDVHSHPGRCFLAGLDASSPLVAFLGAEDSRSRVRSAAGGEVSVVNVSSVADLVVMGLKDDGGLGAVRSFEPGEARSDHDRQLAALADLSRSDGIRPVLVPEDFAPDRVTSGGIAGDSDEVGAFLSCEGADFLDGDLGGLADAYRDGVRSITLVHYRVNELGDIQTEAAVHGGLTGFGREVTREMNRLGLIVDLAHATFATTAAALEESSAPIMISHSHLARPGADHPRLLSQEHAAMVADACGLIGAWPAGFAQETLDDYCDEICRLAEAIGVAHVAIGTDLDANYQPVLTDYSQFPDVARQLAERGMTTDEVDRILGGNFVDLFASVAAQGASQ